MKKNISKINTTFSERLKRRCVELGYNTESKLYDALYAKYPNISSPAVHSWWSYVSIPSNNNLVCLADVLDCDIDYLFGRIENTKHDINFICKETHLSEPAVRQLMRQKSKQTNLFKDTNVISYRPIHDAIDNLLTDERGLEILKTIGYYLYSDNLTLHLNGKPASGKLTLHSKHSDESYPFPTSNYAAVQLLTIQTKLAELRSVLSKKSELL